ncbi:MAG: hypothetical protein R3C05_25405 [Pirellulaceae bacterium]
MNVPNVDRLDAFMASAIAVLPQLGDIVGRIEQSPASIGDDPFLAIAAPIRDQARYWSGRLLVRFRYFDEAIPLIQSLEPQDVIAPRRTSVLPCGLLSLAAE